MSSVLLPQDLRISCSVAFGESISNTETGHEYITSSDIVLFGWFEYRNHLGYKSALSGFLHGRKMSEARFTNNFLGVRVYLESIPGVYAPPENLGGFQKTGVQDN